MIGEREKSQEEDTMFKKSQFGHFMRYTLPYNSLETKAMAFQIFDLLMVATETVIFHSNICIFNV